MTIGCIGGRLDVASRPTVVGRGSMVRRRSTDSRQSTDSRPSTNDYRPNDMCPRHRRGLEVEVAAHRLPVSRVIALALAVGVFFTAEEALMDLAGRRSQLVMRDVVNGAVYWAVWAAFTPVALAAIYRWPLGGEGKSIARPVVANLIAALVLAATHNVISYVVQHPGASLGGANGTAFVWGVFTGVIFYAAILLVYTAGRFSRL